MPDSIISLVPKDEAYAPRYARACEICGNSTDSIDEHICRKCANALRKIIYGGKIE